jgi:hypothetical protein
MGSHLRGVLRVQRWQPHHFHSLVVFWCHIDADQVVRGISTS